MRRDYREYLNIFENLDKVDHGLEKCNFFKLAQEEMTSQRDLFNSLNSKQRFLIKRSSRSCLQMFYSSLRDHISTFYTNFQKIGKNLILRPV